MQLAAEAVAAFRGKPSDYRSWEGAAYALGHEDFFELLSQQLSENRSDGLPRDCCRAFQAKLARAIRRRLGE
ncbi:MAG: hypothetical protein MJ240_08935 [Kiritimatiellae bacterium]|nr:hypothetical protein [Kiritimatiellia bacterium]